VPLRFSDVIREIHDKMIRRHPHVFGETRAKDSADVLRNWEQIKSRGTAFESESHWQSVWKQRPKEVSLLDGVVRPCRQPWKFPAYAQSARIGFDWKTARRYLREDGEETGNCKPLWTPSEPRKVEEELGRFALAAVNLARFLKVDPGDLP